MATRLYPSQDAQNKDTNSLKLKIDCKDRLSTNPETKDWLELVEQFKHTSSFVKVYKALVEKNKKIVAKIGKYTLEKEYTVASKLDDLKLPTFINLSCIFTCKDDFRTLNSTTKEVCNGVGDELSIILMPFISDTQIDKYDWNRKNFNIMKNVMKHVCISMIYANNILGFSHGDLHLGNILLKKTQRKTISYGEFGNLELMGVIPIIMDFDKSIFIENNISGIHQDIRDIFSRMSNSCNIKFNCGLIINFLDKKLLANKSPVSISILISLCELIDNIEISYVSSELPPPPNFSKGFKPDYI